MPYRDANGVIYGRYQIKQVIVGPFSVSACARRTDRSPGQAGVSGTSGVKWPAEDTVHHACVLYSSAEQEEAPSNLRRCGRQHPGCAAAHNTAGIQKKTTEGKCLITGQTIMI